MVEFNPNQVNLNRSQSGNFNSASVPNRYQMSAKPTDNSDSDSSINNPDTNEDTQPANRDMLSKISTEPRKSINFTLLPKENISKSAYDELIVKNLLSPADNAGHIKPEAILNNGTSLFAKAINKDWSKTLKVLLEKNIDLSDIAAINSNGQEYNIAEAYISYSLKTTDSARELDPTTLKTLTKDTTDIINPSKLKNLFMGNSKSGKNLIDLMVAKIDINKIVIAANPEKGIAAKSFLDLAKQKPDNIFSTAIIAKASSSKAMKNTDISLDTSIGAAMVTIESAALGTKFTPENLKLFYKEDTGINNSDKNMLSKALSTFRAEAKPLKTEVLNYALDEGMFNFLREVGVKSLPANFAETLTKTDADGRNPVTKYLVDIFDDDHFSADTKDKILANLKFIKDSGYNLNTIDKSETVKQDQRAIDSSIPLEDDTSSIKNILSVARKLIIASESKSKRDKESILQLIRDFNKLNQN